MRGNLVYLPVEVSRREIMSRTFLACRLASAGHDVLVFASDLFDRFGWPGPGIYIGKNVFRTYVPHDMRYYRAMKAVGIAVWYHDEENAIFPGAGPEQWEEQLERRTDLTGLDRDDKVLVWGNFQKAYYASKRLAADVQVVGSVNFELYRPEYADLFADYDQRQTQGAEGYILVNTRFASLNAFYTGRGHVIHSELWTSFASDPERYEALSREGVMLYHFVGLIAELAMKHPQERIFIRPHPIESPDLYRQVFGPLSNVALADSGDAGSWIRRSRCLLHNGCTTAIQASIAQKPVITFMPWDAGEDEATPPLPNEVGTIVRTRDEAIRAIFTPQAKVETGRWPMAISNLATLDSIEALVSASETRAGVDEGRLKAIGRRSTIDFAARHSVYRLFPGKWREVQMRERYFDRSLFNRFAELTEMARKRWPSPVQVERIGPECWRVRPAA